MFLKNRILKWIDAGLLQEDQGKAILEFESSRSYALTGFIALGITTIALGIVSLIAFNWEAIPGWFKILVDLVLLFSLAGGILYTEKTDRPLLFEGGILLFLLLIPASLGLLSQVFHTGGELHEALFLWTASTFPLILFTGRRTSVHLWIVAFLSAILSYLADQQILDEQLSFHLFFVLGPIIFLMAGIALSRFLPGNRSRTGEGFLLWSLLLTLVGSVALPLFSSISPAGDSWMEHNYWPVLLPVSGLALGILAGMARAPGSVRILASLVLILHIIGFSPWMLGLNSSLLFAAFFILEWILLALVFLARGQQSIFDALLAGTGIRFVVVYFEVFGNLALTGIGLILSGLLIIGLAIVFVKRKERISIWLKGLLL